MKIKPHEIKTGKQFRLIHVLSYENVAPFVFSYIKKRNLASFSFFLFNLIYIVIGIVKLGDYISSDIFSWNHLFLNIALGFIVIPLLLVPLHELIHALMYKLMGAPKIRFGADLSQYIFYVAADNYAINFKEMLVVAMTPFILISFILIFGAQSLNGGLSFSLILTLIAHGTMCIGDFAVLSFFFDNGFKDMITFDMVDEKKAYFYKSIAE